jgi:pimeloyl-ACP methyl ester carboxylesterase
LASEKGGIADEVFMAVRLAAGPHQSSVGSAAARSTCSSRGLAVKAAPAIFSQRSPILVLGGEDDPMVPIETQEDIVAALPSHLVRFERFPNCGHSS